MASVFEMYFLHPEQFKVRYELMKDIDYETFSTTEIYFSIPTRARDLNECKNTKGDLVPYESTDIYIKENFEFTY